MTILIDMAEPSPEALQTRCPEHPAASFSGGFGLAGGGMGVYDVCDECGRVFNKQTIPDEW